MIAPEMIDVTAGTVPINILPVGRHDVAVMGSNSVALAASMLDVPDRSLMIDAKGVGGQRCKVVMALTAVIFKRSMDN